MRNRLKSPTMAIGAGVAAIIFAAMWWPERASNAVAQQQRQEYRAPRFPGSNHPDLGGIWQSVNTANDDVRRHAARPGIETEMIEGREQPAAPVLPFGGSGIIPASLGVIENGEIPYKPEAAAKQKENAKYALSRDPEVKCFLPGVPRATYQPYPFQILQTNGDILMSYGFQHASRQIFMTDPGEAPVDSWMGWSRGKWEGETLVVDVTGLNDQTWFDRVGDFHTDALHVVERYTPISPYHLQYEARIEDPNVFTRPWTIRMPLYRRLEPDAEVMENNCVLFSEELLFGQLRRPGTTDRHWEADYGARGGRMVMDVQHRRSKFTLGESPVAK